MNNPRELIMHILYDIEYNEAYSNMALKCAFSKNKDIKQIDKAFITSLVYGIVARKYTLDYIISQNSKIKLKKISKYILIILRMGIYQLKYMDKVPESAAVNESVKLAKRYGHSASAGFVNGVLRSVIRNDVLKPKDKYEKIAYEYSYPVNLCEKWCNDFGEEFTLKLLDSMNNPAPMSIRVNTLKITPDELISEDNFKKSELYENALLSDGFDVAENEFYKKGYIYPQDISAMFASIVLNPEKGERVLDICAAPGGKTTHIAQLMQNCGEIVACDVHEHKIGLIEKNAQRLGIDIIKTKLADAVEFNSEFNKAFDKVLCDVPCSGYGIIRRKPDIKWKDADNSQIIKTAKEILTNASKYVKIGGELVFSTCTLNKEENELRLKEFLNENDNFEVIDFSTLLPDKLRHNTLKDGYVTFYPHIDGIDGFFIAKIKRCR